MSSHVSSTPRLTRALGLIDLACAGLMLTYPALFVELIYPQLTPYGVILAIKVLGWWRFGRGVCIWSATRSERVHVAAWLWLASVPLHCVALNLNPLSLYTVIWHTSHLCLAMYVSRCIFSRPSRYGRTNRSP